MFSDGHIVVFSEFVEPRLINHVRSLIDQNVCIAVFAATLRRNDLLHGRVILVLLDLRFELWIITTKAFGWDIIRVEVGDHFVVKFVPLIATFLAFLDIAVVVSTLSRSLVHDNANQVVLGVLVALLAIVDGLLLLVQIFKR